MIIRDRSGILNQARDGHGAQIWAAAEIGELNKNELATRFRACRRTITKALAAPGPAPWKQPFKNSHPPTPPVSTPCWTRCLI